MWSRKSAGEYEFVNRLYISGRIFYLKLSEWALKRKAAALKMLKSFSITEVV